MGITASLSGKARTLKALANEKRLRIALALYESPLSFSDIARKCGFTSSSELSFHLNVMRGIISKRVDGKYELTPTGKTLVELVRGLPPMDVSVERVPPSPLDLALIASTLIVTAGTVLLGIYRTGEHYILFSNAAVCAALILIYFHRFQLIEKHPYLVNLPAFVQLLSSPIMTPHERGVYINKIFRASLILAFTYSLISALELYYAENIPAIATVLTLTAAAFIILYYRRIYNELKERVLSRE